MILDYPKNIRKVSKESNGYFPYPIKWVDGKWIINYENREIPLGSEIISINESPIWEVIKNLYKYYPTDGVNKTGKKIGIRGHFSKYYRLHYGLTETFKIKYKLPNSSVQYTKLLSSTGYLNYYKNLNNMYSKPTDQFYYADLKENQKYKFEQRDSSTGILTIYTFSMGNETTEEHNRYCNFLDRTFSEIKTNNINNLIVDVRQNSGGTDPNDLVTYSYLTQRKLSGKQTSLDGKIITARIKTY